LIGLNGRIVESQSNKARHLVGKGLVICFLIGKWSSWWRYSLRLLGLKYCVELL